MRNSAYLVVSIFFGALAAVGIFLVAVRQLSTSVANIVMFLVGLLAMGFLSTFQRLLDARQGKPLVQITFNENLAASQLGNAAKRAGVEIIDAEIVNDRGELDVAPEELLGRDNSLALAKLRIDIEREIKRTAASAGISERALRVGIRPLAQELARRKIIDNELISVLDDVLSVANQAVHGKEISTDAASGIVRLGEKLIGVLRATAGNMKRAY
jgi:hypothetical protein